ncbi:MAG: hypothetical protein PVJ57_00885 [Phycisphaerae bacterium]|jgi:hypothetical protein
MPNKLTAIAANTFTETVRQPVYGVLLWVAVFWVAFISPAFAAFTLVAGSDKKIMIDVSLSTLMLYGLLASVFSATSVITREIESHTVLTVISKPVSRPVFLLGKYLGVTGAVAVGYYFLCLALFLTVRHGTMETAADKYDQPVLIFGLGAVLISLIAATFTNYIYGWHFSSTLTAFVVPLASIAMLVVLFISPEWAMQNPLAKDATFSNCQLLYAVAATFCGVLILCAFAVALATRLGQVLTLTACAGVFILGLHSDYLFGRFVTEGPLYQILYAAIPNFQFFWLGDPLTQELLIPGMQVAFVAGYAALYALAVLAIGVTMFQTREVS